jgi:osmotically-inducible protein OsmY
MVGGGCAALALWGTTAIAASPTVTGARAVRSAEIGDRQITRAVEEQLVTAEGVPRRGVHAASADGIVTLSGTVDDLLARDRAANVAKAVRGVRGVVNTLDVRPSGRTDASIRDDVERALVNDPATESYEIDLRVDDGVVTLLGAVDSWQERDLASTVVKQVRGVRAVRNRIDVIYPHERPDDEIESDVEQRLRWDARLEGGLIDVEVDDGTVRLTGMVGSAAAKSLAHNLSWVTGVSDVDSQKLEVQSWLRERHVRKTPAQSSDAEIARAIRDALRYDPRVASASVDPAVQGGVVVLSGVVDGPAAKAAAERTTRHVVGVWKVKNHLEVRPADVPENEDLEARVRDALRGAPLLADDADDIAVAADRGSVRLSGEVDSRYEKFRATDVVSRIKGVTAIQNRLAVAEIRSG